MTLTIELPTDVERTVRQLAEKNGQDVTSFVLEAVNEKLTRVRSFDEAFAPFAQAVEASGISDEEFDSLINEARNEVWLAKHGNE